MSGKKGEDKPCNDFLAAGTSLKSFLRVEETGIGGTICNHRCPLDFVNLKQGEKYLL